MRAIAGMSETVFVPVDASTWDIAAGGDSAGRKWERHTQAGLCSWQPPSNATRCHHGYWASYLDWRRGVPIPRSVYRYYERRLAGSLDRDRLPRHVGVILDGHRRFAREEGFVGYQASYRAGMAKLEELLGWCAELGVQAVTAWVLSTENLRRPEEELEPYFQVLGELFRRLPALSGRVGFSLAVSGSLDLLPAELALAAKEATARSAGGPLQVNIALCYGGRQEIVDACRALVGELAERGLAAAEMAEAVDAEGIAKHLYAADLPDTDLVIRTSGESRLSGFLLWQSAYAEFAFVDPYWPAFRRIDLLRALRDYSRRQRRFGA